MEAVSLEKFKSLCRTCLRPSTEMYPLTDDSTLINKIEMISSVQITLTQEGLPTSICRDCLNNINHFYCFRKMIINSENEWKEQYEALLVKLEMTYENDNENYFEEEEEEKVVFEQASPQIVSEHCEEISDKQKKRVRKKVKEKKPRIKKYDKKKAKATPGMCSICGIVVRADNLSKHLRTHCDRSVECETCGKTLKNRESLRGHRLIHKDVVFTCEICGKTYKVKAEHRRHMKTHEDPDLRKVECTLCGKKVSEMKRHLLSHTGEKPFPCTYCKKGFTSTYALKVHSRQHTNEKPFICEYCSMSFFQKTSLVTHLKSKHNIISK